ncbi:MAG: BNR-4 repeat-containing protein [Planctomycetes bacterium]|nr:BNR-4 repeat-containing protein [Planctomycetota bacterium]
MRHRERRLLAALGLFVGALPAQDPEPLPLADNGVWCWFQDERAVVDAAHPDGPLLLFSTVAFGGPDADTHGDIDVHWRGLDDGTQGSFTLHDRLQPDDHDGAALCVRADGRYLAVYTQHSADRLVRWRVSERPHDPSAWREERTFENAVRVCYSNVFHLRDAQGRLRLFDFVRADGFDPNWFVSDDDGDSFVHGGKLHTGPGGNEDSGQRPYVKYASNDPGALHFVTTDGHPRDEDNSIYHGVLRRGRLFDSGGRLLGALSCERTAKLRSPDFTTVMATGTKFGGAAMRHAWTIDLAVDDAGEPYTVFVARADDQDTDHRFFYARCRDGSWTVRELCRAGGFLYQRENDYTGLVALHPHDPDLVFVSTTVDPRDGASLPHHELFCGHTTDGAASWAWTPITWGSRDDNLRPVVPRWDGDHTALLWVRGRMNTYTDWRAAVVGRVVTGRGAEVFRALAVGGQDAATRPACLPDR